MSRRLVFVVALVALLVSMVGLSPNLAQACGPEYSTAQYRTQAETIFAGRILDRKALETRFQDGTNVTLYQLTVYVDSALKGEAATGAMATVYVVARTDESAAVEPAITGDVAVLGNGELATLDAQPVLADPYAASTSYYGYSYPDAPQTMGSYLFFAKPFGDGEYVLYSNSVEYLDQGTSEEVDATRVAIAQGVPYYDY